MHRLSHYVHRGWQKLAPVASQGYVRLMVISSVEQRFCCRIPVIMDRRSLCAADSSRAGFQWAAGIDLKRRASSFLYLLGYRTGCSADN